MQLFWTNVKVSLFEVEQMLSVSTSPADPTPVGAMVLAATQLEELLPRTCAKQHHKSSDVGGPRHQTLCELWLASVLR